MKTLYHLGRYVLWLGQVFKKPENLKMYWRETVRQMNSIGIGSLVIIAIISIFIGAVTAVQFSYQMGDSLIPRYYIGYIVRDMTIIELAPTFSCMVLAGKVGSSLASEIGGMRQKEHIDAMEIMGVNTAAFLVQPKILAALTIIPMLVCIGAFISICGGYIASVPFGRFSHEEYEQGLRSFFIPYNITMMFVKALTFSFILTTVSCYQGYFVKGGSIELGHASTQAVVYSNILILLSDYVIAMLMTA
ncbi:MAG: ABC transporter permease [Saprospiraceae bacterium]|jgi:phospholipid/cholesterol/gamma-HCH transport system permease protein|nr:ABC transporter permease [Candidatus Defluviibacterium haderslevense]MBK7242229.1 ABC transporter permease [Candidatus Defluviibacterium haderslevense]MBK8242225.1 ABC transporter permease [Candidatus Defluviibacterium haderslevense]MCC7028038.1 ABC transporter permease [Saprospiraceae bacterium]MCI1267337.1 ABC transporter permease [Saprospiraceae bacterium]